MTALVLPFLRPTNPTQRQRAREESMRYDVRCSLPGIADWIVREAQDRAVEAMTIGSYDEARNAAVTWARNQVPQPPRSAA